MQPIQPYSPGQSPLKRLPDELLLQIDSRLSPENATRHGTDKPNLLHPAADLLYKNVHLADIDNIGTWDRYSIRDSFDTIKA